MKIGVSTSCFYPLLTEKSLELVGENGVKLTEIFFNANSELENSFVAELVKIKEHYGIDVVSVHPTMSLAESYVLFSGYERRFREGLDSYKRYAEAAVKLGAKYIIMHGGKPNKFLTNEEYCHKFFEVARAVKENGATLLQENVVKFRAGDLDFLKNMVKILGNDANLCLDIKQSIRGGYSPFDVVESVGENIRHIHISDNSKAGDCLLPSKGTFDFKKLFADVKKKGYNGAAIIEVYDFCYKDYSEVFESARLVSSEINNVLEK
ncbi:MAG: sugar phosphate isomerase/epimerase [Clostridia bacterium]|nr:sugar phosphate isomerase/epimerase [Clostridia bacterium]